MKRLRELVKWFYKRFPSGGFLHIVLDDGNYETRHIVWCLLHWKDYLTNEEIEWVENNENEIREMCTLLLELKEKDRYKIWKE